MIRRPFQLPFALSVVSAGLLAGACGQQQPTPAPTAVAEAQKTAEPAPTPTPAQATPAPAPAPAPAPEPPKAAEPANTDVKLPNPEAPPEKWKPLMANLGGGWKVTEAKLRESYYDDDSKNDAKMARENSLSCRVKIAIDSPDRPSATIKRLAGECGYCLSEFSTFNNVDEPLPFVLVDFVGDEVVMHRMKGGREQYREDSEKQTLTLTDPAGKKFTSNVDNLLLQCVFEKME